MRIQVKSLIYVSKSRQYFILSCNASCHIVGYLVSLRIRQLGTKDIHYIDNGIYVELLLNNAC